MDRAQDVGILNYPSKGNNRPPIAVFLVIKIGIPTTPAEEATARLDYDRYASSSANCRGHSRDSNTAMPWIKAVVRQQVMDCSPII